MKNKRYFPLYVDLSDKNVVVVGGGTIATRRVKALLLFTRNITVIAPKMTAWKAWQDPDPAPPCEKIRFFYGVYGAGGNQQQGIK